MSSAFMSAAYIQVHFRLDFIMESITTNLGSHCLHYRLQHKQTRGANDKGRDWWDVLNFLDIVTTVTVVDQCGVGRTSPCIT